MDRRPCREKSQFLRAYEVYSIKREPPQCNIRLKTIERCGRTTSTNKMTDAFVSQHDEERFVYRFYRIIQPHCQAHPQHIPRFQTPAVSPTANSSAGPTLPHFSQRYHRLPPRPLAGLLTSSTMGAIISRARSMSLRAF